MGSAEYFDLGDILAAAEEEAGCSDWGEDDIRHPLGVLVDSLNREKQITEAGRARVKLHLHTILTARLRLLNDRKIFPEIVQENVKAPIFLTGAQRAGTSYLYSLLTSDSGNIGFYNWHIVAPSPPPNHPKTDQELQIARAEEVWIGEGWLEPYVREKHDYGVRIATEDVFIHEMSLIALDFAFFWGAAAYAEFLGTADFRKAYRFEKMFLQALQFGLPGGQVVLKSPSHISMLDALFDVFPDARLVVNHRDPRKLFGSLMSLMAAQRRQFGCPFTADRSYALMAMEGVASGFEDMLRRRKDPEVDRRFIDVNFLDLERDPIGQVRRIYDRFGMTLDKSSEDAMRKFTAVNRKGKYGKHKYTLEDSGLTEREVLDRFRSYSDSYDVQWED